MIKAFIIFVSIILPLPVLAAARPSMASMWIELILLVVMLVVLKFAKFSNQQKFIAFITYVLSGIITKTTWVPVLIFVIMFYIFNQDTDDDS